MRYVVAFIGVVVSVGLISVSIMMNFRFGQMLGKTELDGVIYGIASGCADGFKVILPFTAAWAWRNNRYLAALASVTLFIIFSAYSITSSLGFSATNRAETSGARIKVATEYKYLRREFDRAVKERDRLAEFRPTAALQGLIRAKQQHFRWSRTSECAEATVGLSRDFCNEYFQLKAELGTAKKAGALDEKIAEYGKRLKQFTGIVAVGGKVDPQVQILKEISGLAENKVELALTIILTLLVELGSGFGLFVTFAHGQGEKSESREYTKFQFFSEAPEPLLIEHASATDKDWAIQRLIHDPASQTSLNDLYQDYCQWCQIQERTDVMTLTSFGKWVLCLGFDQTKRIYGRIYFVGLRINTYKTD